MAGKMLFGDPMLNAEFTRSTGTDLVKDAKTVLVIASAPSAVKSQYPSLELDVQDGLTRRLKREGIQVIPPDEVSSWLDDRGGYFDDVNELVPAFEADFIIHVEIDHFTHHEDNSPKLYRGQARGEISAYKVSEYGGQKRALSVFNREFTSVHPKNYAISTDDKSAVVFQKEYLDQVCQDLALRFYRHRLSEEVE